MNLLFSAAFEDRSRYESAPPPDDYVRDRLADPHFVALVAVEGETMLGALAAYELPKFEQARSELYIYDLAVDEAHRRRGVATALIAALHRHAAVIGARVIFVQANSPDALAVALYRKARHWEAGAALRLTPAGLGPKAS